MEIYNETIRDLLSPSLREDVKHEIRLVGPNTNEVYVTNLTNSFVSSIEEVRSQFDCSRRLLRQFHTRIVFNFSKVHELLKVASENRSVAETRCNERSSRSHSVFRMKITGKNDKTGESRAGKCGNTPVIL